MRVLVNATDGALSLRAIRRFVIELASGLTVDRPDLDVGLTFFTHRRSRVRDFLAQLPPEAQYRVHWFPAPRRFWNQRHARSRFELERLARRYDLYHETTTDNPRFEGLPVVTSVHGLCTLVAPEILDDAFNQGKTAWFDRCVGYSQFWTPVSETSKREFLERFDVDAACVRAIPLGVSQQYRPRAFSEVKGVLADRFGLDRPYVLYVGGIQRNKNVERVLDTYRHLVTAEGFDGRLVLAGDLNYPEDVFRSMLADRHIEDRVDWVGCFNPEDPLLATLYQGAAMFLFPSFYEGWTSPPLEAMASGVPTIASSASSIPETVGQGALLADPHCAEEWCAAASRIVQERGLRESLVERGIRRAGEYPWSRHVETTVDFYRAIVDGTWSADRSDSSASGVSSEPIGRTEDDPASPSRAESASRPSSAVKCVAE